MRALSGKYILIVFLGLLVAVRLAIDFSGAAARNWHDDYKELQAEESAFYARFFPHHDVNPLPSRWESLHSNYPPHSFVIYSVLAPPGVGRNHANQWFTLVQLAALVFAVAFTARQGGPDCPWLGLTLTLGLLAMTGLHADIAWGNFSLILTAALIGLLYAANADRWWLAASLWALAMAKPQFGWAFAPLFITRKAWKPWVSAVACLGLFTIGACLWMRVDLLRVIQAGTLQNWSSMASVSERHSLTSLLIVADVPPMIASTLCAAAGAAFLLRSFTRTLAKATPLHRIALAGLVCRIASYHNICDDLLLLFALVWLGRRVWSSGRRADILAFVALGISVWAPTAAVATIPAKIAIVSLWILIAAHLARDSETPADLPAPSR